jgi:hypothetical protein
MRDLALYLVRASFPAETEPTLERWILSTGYAEASRPHASTRDLFFVYAANLLNSGLPGPRSLRFGALIAEALDREWIRDDRLTTAVDIRVLAKVCGELLEQGVVIPLTDGGIGDYPGQIRAIVKGRPATEKVIYKLLGSIAMFSQFIVNRHGGSAAIYHASFACSDSTRQAFVARKFHELDGIPLLGLAVRMNLLKDTQASSLAPRPLTELADAPIAWFVKPDMHVLRLMACATGRTLQAGIDVEALAAMKADKLVRRCRAFEPKAEFAVRYVTEEARAGDLYWRCIEEMQGWAVRCRVAPLAFDRLLYLIGSGNFHDGGATRELRISQVERYRRFCALFN